MSEPASKPNPEWLRRLIASILLGAAGFVLNSFATEVFPGVHFIWGGILYFIAVLAFGERWGTLAGAIAASRTVILWGNPYALITLSIEAYVVGRLVRKGREGFVADAIFWFVLGFPLTVLIDVVWLQREIVTSLVIITKLPVNSLICVMVAGLVLRIAFFRRFLGLPQRARHARLLRTTLAYVFSLAMVVPLLLFSLVYGNYLVSRLTLDSDRKIELEGKEAAENIAGQLEQYRFGMRVLAQGLEVGGDFAPEVLDAALADFHNDFPAFSGVLAADREGRIVGGHPLLDGSGVPLRAAGHTVADLPFFREPSDTGRNHISNAFVGRIFVKTPIVAVSSPVYDKEGAKWGVVAGSIAVDRFKRSAGVENLPERGTLLVLDGDDRVVYSDEEKYSPLSTMAGTEIIRAAESSSEGTVFNFGYDAAARLDEGIVGVKHLVRVQGLNKPWTVVVYINESRVQAPARQFFALVLIGLFLMFGLATVVANSAAAVVTRPLEDLVESIRGMSLGSGTHKAAPVRGGSAEISNLVDDFNSMAARLGESYELLQKTLGERESLNEQLRQLVDELEYRVRERTEELRVSEERLRFALTLSNTGGWEYDLDNRFAERNAQHDLMFGYSPMLPEWTYALFLEHVLPADRKKVKRRLRRSIRSRENFIFECRIRRSDGAVRWVRIAGGHRRESSGDASRVTGIIQDVTELKRAEEERRRLESQIQQARKLESLGIMAGGIAHDFNNLLTSIIGYADLAKRRLPDDSPSGSSLDHVIGSARKAIELTDKMLAYSGKGHFILKEFDLNEVIADAAHMLRVIAGDKIDVEFDLQPGLAAIEGDESQWQKAVLALVSNAAEAIGDTEGTVSIATRSRIFDKAAIASLKLDAELLPGDHIVLEVTDTGRGMTSDVQEKMFEPFFSTKFVGRGLGLPVVQGIVRGHRGGIAVDSAPDRGTNITILIPAVPGVSTNGDH